MELRCTAFAHEGLIPRRYSCDGEDVSPPLVVEGLPEGTVSLALVMDDPDAPGRPWDHWVAYDIPPISLIGEGAKALGTPGTNSWGRTGYGGPCCPRGQTHRYFFRVYALDTRLGLAAGAEKATLLSAMSEHVLDEAMLMGRFSR